MKPELHVTTNASDASHPAFRTTSPGAGEAGSDVGDVLAFEFTV
jgi:hypothetical protein